MHYEEVAPAYVKHRGYKLGRSGNYWHMNGLQESFCSVKLHITEPAWDSPHDILACNECNLGVLLQIDQNFIHEKEQDYDG